MACPISVEKFADMVMKNNRGYRRAELVQTLRDTLKAKENGAVCMICGSPIWAAGSAMTGSYMCFTCTTGEADDSEDYEIAWDETSKSEGNRRQKKSKHKRR